MSNTRGGGESFSKHDYNTVRRDDHLKNKVVSILPLLTIRKTT